MTTASRRFDVRQRVLRVARQLPYASCTEIAAAAGCHPDTARKHLLALRPRSEPPGAAAQVRARAVKRLAASRYDANHRTVIESPLAPRWLIARYEPGTVRRPSGMTASANPRLPARRLAAMVANPAEHSVVRATAAANPNCPGGPVKRLLLEGDPADDKKVWPNRTLAAAASHPQQSADTLAELLAGVPPAGLAAAAASNPNCPPHALAAVVERCRPTVTSRFGRWLPDSVVVAAVANSNLDPSHLPKLIDALAPGPRMAAAARADCDPETLGLFAVDSSPEVRAAAAANPNTPQDDLLRLAGDEKAAVRAAVAGNPGASHRLLLALVEAADMSIRSALAANSAAWPMPAGELLHAEPEVRAAAAASPHCPTKWVGWLAGPEQRTAVRVAALMNPNCPRAVLAGQAANGDPELRRAVAANPSCPRVVLQALADDPEPEVRLTVTHPDRAFGQL